MKKMLFIMSIALPSISFSLLPPLYDTLAEFKSLINDDRLPQSLDSARRSRIFKKLKTPSPSPQIKAPLQSKSSAIRLNSLAPANFTWNSLQNEEES